MDNIITNSERHPVVSFFIDGYFFETILNLIGKMIPIETNIKLVIGIIFFFLLIYYHAKVYKTTKFRTIGELFSGTFLNSDGIKVYVNPFGKNRFLLWVIMFVTLVNIKSSNFFTSFNTTPLDLLILLFFILYIYCSFIAYNRGYTFGFIMIIILYLFQIIYSVFFQNLFAQEINFKLLFSFVIPIICLLIFIIYWIMKIKNKINSF